MPLCPLYGQRRRKNELLISGERATSDGYNGNSCAHQIYTLDKGVERDNFNIKLTYDIDATSSAFISGSYYDNETTGTLAIDNYVPYYQEHQNLLPDKKFENDNELSLKVFLKDEYSDYDSANSTKTAVQYESSAYKR